MKFCLVLAILFTFIPNVAILQRYLLIIEYTEIPYTDRKVRVSLMFPFDKVYQKVILYRIAKKQREMIEIGARFGLNDSRTVESSQELDKLITKYQEINHIKSVQQSSPQ
ncbi:aspartyl-phosphate phosphatase Spo0E family protein [Bacillus salacetis]|nr:aspartyl-phosphate phosphatase Spo0E family protein [Bacillus salacetis]